MSDGQWPWVIPVLTLPGCGRCKRRTGCPLGQYSLSCTPIFFPNSLRFCLSLDPLGLNYPCNVLFVSWLCPEHPVGSTCPMWGLYHDLHRGGGLWSRKHGKPPSLTLPVSAVVRALQPGALPPVLVSPHRGPAKETRGKWQRAQPKVPWWHVQVHP